jgi:hypothetical protein
MSDIFNDFDKKNSTAELIIDKNQIKQCYITDDLTKNFHEIPKFATGGICNDAIFPKADYISEFEKIAKDIVEKQDNAKAMEFTKSIGTLLRENGVTPIVTECRNETTTKNSYKCQCGYVFESLDFSEHDKVFEDKIDEQKNEISMLKSLIDNYRDAESKLFDENKELKQRIAELEGEEEESFNEIPDSITIDGYKCKIIKTESGLYISRDEIYNIIDKEKEPYKKKCKELEDRHQSDCIEINRLNTTIDVLIHKVEYLRQFAGLE